MKSYVILCALFQLFILTSSAPANGSNNTDIISAEELKTHYANILKYEIKSAMELHMKCFLNESPCANPRLGEFKKKLFNFMKDKCSVCTNEQKIFLSKGIKDYKTEHPIDYAKFLKLYDPNEAYYKHITENL
ncbi:ejaculatory bulb-specific protein 3-like [Daktulosphaira vitifoliae]|uniref:ejaculatory bulb-specific protein 3-like n=1 Tax=Daktulosphaira vitifoliae TaxID=58002 RepID=UPI0021A9CB90|nr:ejaculatory bulb-specific protein 3-like [Daktulosphaira vitifoliae]